MKDKKLKVEKRTAKRFQILMAVTIDTEEYGCFSAVIVNISDKGIFVQTYDPLPLGTRVTVIMGDYDGFLIKGVVRSHYYMKYKNSSKKGEGFTGMGIHFRYFENMISQDNTPPPLFN
ncbi:MAG: PilZ domain-containing protein [Myxococcota bacterium]